MLLPVGAFGRSASRLFGSLGHDEAQLCMGQLASASSIQAQSALSGSGAAVDAGPRGLPAAPAAAEPPYGRARADSQVRLALFVAARKGGRRLGPSR